MTFRWDHRIIQYADGSFGLHEVFYDANGEVSHWSSKPAQFLSGPAEGSAGVLRAMAAADAAARQHPVLFQTELPSTFADPAVETAFKKLSLHSLTLLFLQETGGFTVQALEYDVAAQGDTAFEALERFVTTLWFSIQMAAERGGQPLQDLPVTPEKYLRAYLKLPNDRTLGQIAFDAYNADRGGVNYQGLKTPEWPDLPEGIRHAWEVAVQAIVGKLLPPSV